MRVWGCDHKDHGVEGYEMKAKDPPPANQASSQDFCGRTAGGAAEIWSTPANQASLQDFCGCTTGGAAEI